MRDQKLFYGWWVVGAFSSSASPSCARPASSVIEPLATDGPERDEQNRLLLEFFSS